MNRHAGCHDCLLPQPAVKVMKDTEKPCFRRLCDPEDSLPVTGSGQTDEKTVDERQSKH